jgi:hypothetical protein
VAQESLFLKALAFKLPEQWPFAPVVAAWFAALQIKPVKPGSDILLPSSMWRDILPCS